MKKVNRRKLIENFDVFEKHQLKIARRTLEMSDIGTMVMGDMTKKEAREIIDKLNRR